MVNDCINKSCSYVVQPYSYYMEYVMPLGDYECKILLMTNTGQKIELSHSFRIVQTDIEYKKALSPWMSKINDFAQRRTRENPFSDKIMWQYIDTAKFSPVRDRLVTRMFLELDSKEEFEQSIKLIPTIQDKNILLFMLYRLLLKTWVGHTADLSKGGENRFSYYERMVTALIKRDKEIAKIFVNMIIVQNIRPERFFTEGSPYTINDFLTAKEMNALEKMVRNS